LKLRAGPFASSELRDSELSSAFAGSYGATAIALAQAVKGLSMGDAGEGLIDADAKIQERMEELQLSRARAKRPAVKNPEQLREIESLRLARTELSRQLEVTTHEARRAQITQALKEIDRRIAEAESSL
jgi:hypothetical protein